MVLGGGQDVLADVAQSADADHAGDAHLPTLLEHLADHGEFVGELGVGFLGDVLVGLVNDHHDFGGIDLVILVESRIQDLSQQQVDHQSAQKWRGEVHEVDHHGSCPGQSRPGRRQNR